MSSDELATLIDGDSASNTNEHARAYDNPFNRPVRPVQYRLDDKIQFNCHQGIACFNRCCKNIAIQLTPYDILRLQKHFNIGSREFVARFTYPFEMDVHGIPGLGLIHKPASGECIFLTEEGCSVYRNRPTACRQYPLGIKGIRKKKDNKVYNVYFMVKEDHCLGHNESKSHTIREYLHEQEADHYDQYNEDWRDIIIKKGNSGPIIGKPSERSMQLFDMCSYDIDSFRVFIQGSGFLNLFDIDQNTLDILINNDEELLLFAMRFLKQILYSEKTIPLKQRAKEKHREKQRDTQQIRREIEITTHTSADQLENLVDS